MAAGNWFDDVADESESEEIEVIDGYYSVEDNLATLLGNEEVTKTVKGWLMKNGNLTMTSMLSTVADMMGHGKLPDVLHMTGGVTPAQLAQLNRMLIKIKK